MIFCDYPGQGHTRRGPNIRNLIELTASFLRLVCVSIAIALPIAMWVAGPAEVIRVILALTKSEVSTHPVQEAEDLTEAKPELWKLYPCQDIHHKNSRCSNIASPLPR